jgi:hypothetical protein
MSFFDWIQKLWAKDSTPQVGKIPEVVARAFRARADLNSGCRFIFEVDYSINAKYPRLFVYDIKTGELLKYKCAHGVGGKNRVPRDGWIRELSNKPGSYCSSLGVVKTGVHFKSDATGESVRLNGLSPTNSNMYARGCHLHGGAYVQDNAKNSDTSIPGFSQGCVVVAERYINRQTGGELIEMLKDGSIGVLHYAGRFFEGSPETKVIEAPKPSSEASGVYASWPDQAWAKHAEKCVREIGLDKLSPKDAKDFFPSGATTRNWVHLLGAMCKHESGYKPATTYKENFKSSASGDFVISTGLFQVSYGSLRGYGIQTTTEKLKEPLHNIECAVKVLHKLVKENVSIAGRVNGKWQGGARYWAVLRTPKVDTQTKITLKRWAE